MRRGRWDNWATIAAGLALALSWVWHDMLGLSGGMLLALGLGIIMASVISITRPGALTSEAATAGLGVLAFLLPWIMGFTYVPVAAWSAWILGAAITALGVYGFMQAREARRRDPELAWGTHTLEV